MSRTNEGSAGPDLPSGDRTYPIRRDELASEVVYTAIAELTGRSPMELTPLASAIDPDALNALVATDDSLRDPGYVSFDYEGYRITVTDDELALRPQQPRSSEQGQ